MTLEQEIEEILSEMICAGGGDKETLRAYAEQIANLAREVLDVKE